METQPRDLKELEAFYLTVFRRLHVTALSVYTVPDAHKGVLVYVLSGLGMGAIVTLFLGAFTAFFWFLVSYVILLVCLGAFDLHVERRGHTPSGGAASMHEKAQPASAPPVPAEPVAPAQAEESADPFAATMRIKADDGADLLRSDLERMASEAEGSAAAEDEPTARHLGTWIDQVDKHLKKTLRSVPYQEARSGLTQAINSADTGGARGSLQAGAAWLRAYASKVDDSYLA